MKRVAHVYSSWTAGGAEKILLSLAAGLELAGVRNVVVAPADSYLFAEARRRCITARPAVIKGSFDPFGIAALWRIVRDERIGIIHAHQGKVFWACLVVKLLCRLRAALSPEGGPSVPAVVFHRHADLPHRFYSRWHYTLADRVIAISHAVAQGLVTRERVAPAKVAVVYNGTDFERFTAGIPGDAVRREHGLDGALVVGTVAAMNRPRGKGQGFLLEAAAALRERFPALRLLMVGDGEMLADFKDEARRRGVDGITVFAGYREQVERYIAAMDIFCFLSWDTEGFGQVMVEAQALGKPVIGTAIGGIPETFQPGVTGLLIPPSDPAAAADAIASLAGDPGRRQALGTAGAAFVRERFSLGRMIGDVKAIYDVL